MSSVVKKGSNFSFLKKKPIKRKANLKTPPSTQKKKENDGIDNRLDSDNENDNNTSSNELLTPQPTQNETETDINKSDIDNDDPLAPTDKILDSNITPESVSEGETIAENGDQSKITPVDDLSPALTKESLNKLNSNFEFNGKSGVAAKDNNEKNDNDQVSELRSRRGSLVSGRRLSGITPIAFKNRSASIISISGVPVDSNELTGKPPAKIGIPIAKVTKRRRSSAVKSTARTEPNITNLLSTESTPAVDEQDEEQEEQEKETAEDEEGQDEDDEDQEVIIPEDDGSSPFVIALDPISKRLRKFRRKTARDIEFEKRELLKQEKIEAAKRDLEKLTESENVENNQDLPSTRRRKLRESLYQTVEKPKDPEVSVNISEDEIEKQESEDELKFELEQQYEILPDDPQRIIEKSEQLPRSVKDEDAELYENIGLNTKVFTIADLCKPSFPIGKLSSNFKRAQEAEKKMKAQKLKRREEREIARSERIPLETVIARSAEPETCDVKKKVENFLNTDPEPSTTSGQLQMRLDHDGKMVVDEDSLTRNRHANVDRSNRIVEEANPFENPVISTTYGKRRYTDRWTPDEVKQFYVALSTFGTDFLMISQLFPYRNRKQIKLKFNLEEKKYPEIIEMALKRKLPADFDSYCNDSGIKIETLDHYNSQLEQVRVEHQLHISQIEEEKEKAAKEDAEASRKREYQIRTGSIKISRKEKLQELRRNEQVVGTIDNIKKQPVE